MVQIRHYKSTDLNEIARLMEVLGYPTSPENMKRRLNRIESNPNYKTFVAVIENKVVGMIGLNTIMNYESDDLVKHILSLVTKPEFQGQGIGRSLMDLVL